MRTEQGVIIHRGDYSAPGFAIDSIHLAFDLDPDDTLVTATSLVRRIEAWAHDWLLNGDELTLVDVCVDGEALPADRFRVEGSNLRLIGLPDRFELRVRTRIAPARNTALMGLYLSNGNFFTQCEAEGFRRITFFPDRPDVMTRYTVLLRADEKRFPVLLANGNLLASGRTDAPEQGVNALPPGWHWALWVDPFPKPSYLFALVAGTLVAQEERLRTRSGREVLLQVWVEPGNLDKTAHAMTSLVKSIQWDEQRFGLELDLDRFMIVAVSDFNMGAMENKGLNIFNTKYVFANPRIATDLDFANIESVVGHEYFHNWTGNRVTCRDWFQLTLKEGLTVFRDQEFSADLMAAESATEAAAASARAVKRIEDVRTLRALQFAEDAGPMAHPIRPDSYQEINNFYTLTVYEKGAEVIRMLYTLVGNAGFRKGMDLYFARHDGQAVTCDDFVAAIADANERNFGQFRRWYSQAGTPRLAVSGQYDAQAALYRLRVEQSCPPTPGQPTKEPFHLPLAMALVGPNGQDMNVRLAGAASGAQRHFVLEVTRAVEEFVFESVSEPPVPSLLRGFSAPVILDFAYADAELAFLAAHDSDAFCRWEAGQQLAVRAILRVLGGEPAERASALLVEVLSRTLDDDLLDPSFKELCVTLPSEGFVAEQIDELNPAALRAARQSIRRELATRLALKWQSLYQQLLAVQGLASAYQIDPVSVGRRALRNASLGWWLAAEDTLAYEAAARQFDQGTNMTDRLAALSALVNSAAPQRHDRLARFATEFADEALVMDKWFTLQATAIRQPGEAPTLERVRKLLGHPAFSIKNPNKFRALIGSFCSGNLAEFHDESGAGYEFWAEQVVNIDAINPQVAARLARALDRWRKFEPTRRQLMQAALRRVAATPGLSSDVAEIVGKSAAV